MSRRLYLCTCGCVHLETRHARISLTLDELRARLRAASDRAERPSRGAASTDRPAGRLETE